MLRIRLVTSTGGRGKAEGAADAARPRPAHEKAALRPRFDPALGLELVVGRHHGAGRDAEAARGLAHGRQPGARSPAFFLDALGAVRGQLLGQGGQRVAVEQRQVRGVEHRSAVWLPVCCHGRQYSKGQ
jgi:hypothetical protein